MVFCQILFFLKKCIVYMIWIMTGKGEMMLYAIGCICRERESGTDSCSCRRIQRGVRVGQIPHSNVLHDAPIGYIDEGGIANVSAKQKKEPREPRLFAINLVGASIVIR